MEIQEMHIGIDLGLQAINSNVFGKIQKEEKDYFINSVTREFITLALTDAKNTVFDVNTYSDIRKYYETLQTYIKSIELGYEDKLGYGYIYSSLPTSIYASSVTTGRLWHGARYKVVTNGATDLSDFGSTNPPVINTEFECTLALQSGTSASIVSGNKYKIINSGGIDFTVYGATSSLPGTEFIATSSDSITGGTDIELQNLSQTPSWDGTTDLSVIRDIGYFLNVVTRSSVIKGQPISSGKLTVGKKYIVTTVGSTDLSSSGGVASPDKYYIFTCTTSSPLTWVGTILYEVNDNANRLVKAQDVDDFLNNSFGSIKSSPISIFANNGLRVYYDDKFSIYRLFIDYIIKPISVNYDLGINSDLPESTHDFLIELIVKRISAYSGNPTYNAQVNEVREQQQ